MLEGVIAVVLLGIGSVVMVGLWRAWTGVIRRLEAWEKALADAEAALKTTNDEAESLKTVVERQEGRLTDLGGYTQAATKEIRQHAPA